MGQSKSRKKGIIVVDVKKCLACHTCEIACALEHSKLKDLIQAVFEVPPAQSRISVKKKGKSSVPLQCRHCGDAACIKVCPVKAIERKDSKSPVLINKETCIGCKECIEICPFKVIKMDREGKTAIKCDFCFERLERNQMPCCVMACPTGAIQFKSLEDIDKNKKEKYLVTFKKG